MIWHGFEGFECLCSCEDGRVGMEREGQASVLWD